MTSTTAITPEVLDRLESQLNHASMGPVARGAWESGVAYWFADLAGTIRRQWAEIERLKEVEHWANEFLSAENDVDLLTAQLEIAKRLGHLDEVMPEEAQT